MKKIVLISALVVVALAAVPAHATTTRNTYVSVGPCLLHAYLPHTSGGYQYAHGRMDTCNTGCEGFPTTYCDDADQVNAMEVCLQVYNSSTGQWYNTSDGGVPDCRTVGPYGQTNVLDFDSPPHAGAWGHIYHTWDYLDVSDDGGRWTSTYQSSAWTCC